MLMGTLSGHIIAVDGQDLYIRHPNMEGYNVLKGQGFFYNDGNGQRGYFIATTDVFFEGTGAAAQTSPLQLDVRGAEGEYERAAEYEECEPPRRLSDVPAANGVWPEMVDLQHLEKFANSIRDAAFVAQFSVLAQLRMKPVHQAALDLNYYLYHPIPGDLVAEVTTRKRGVPALDAVGILVSDRDEPVEMDGNEILGGADGKPLHTERVVRIRTLDDREMRWTNCEFFSLVTDKTVGYPEWRSARGKAARLCVEQGLIDQVPEDELV
jgi:hypothetical protein